MLQRCRTGSSTDMSISKKPEAAGGKAARAAVDTPMVAVSRRWLVALGAVLVVPWVVVAVLYLRGPNAMAAPGETAAVADPGMAGGAGPWGVLTITPIVVSPPLEYVAPDWGRPEGSGEWHFPGVSRELLGAYLASIGLPRDAIDRLQAAAKPNPATGGLVISPDPAFVRSMDPALRARIYAQLAKSPLNYDQAHSFRFFGASPEAWLKGSPMSARTRALVEPLIYRDGDFLHFADAAVVRAEIPEAEELQRLAKTLLRQSTMLVRLSVPNASDVPALAEYWGRGGRRTDVRPLLESVAGADTDRSIDIVHVLPAFARNHLYRYPRVTTGDFDKPLLANCLWSSLNFFRDRPDDRFLDVGTALGSLKQDYHIIEHSYQLGDIVGFVDDEGDLFHVAVYLADGLVFTKNGMSPVAPWTIMPLNRLSAYYSRSAGEHRLIYHRRNDF